MLRRFMVSMFAFLMLLPAGCAPIARIAQPNPAACTVTEPAWLTPPEDSAVSGAPATGYYYVNADRSIWGSAWWDEAGVGGEGEDALHAGGEGIKMGWFRPAGAELVITGERIDGEAPPLEAHAPCCYPTRFQASGLVFPTEGCWQVNAEAEGKTLSFIVWVNPEER